MNLKFKINNLKLVSRRGKGRFSLLASYFLLLTVFFSSCEHKELCDDHWDHSPRHQVNFVADWHLHWEYTHEGVNWQSDWLNYDFSMGYDDLRPAKRAGIRTQVYTDGHDNEVSNISADGGIIHMTPDEHQILFYNNDTEYIVFNDLNTLVNASATTRTRTRSTYIGNSKSPSFRDEETTVNPPDHLFAKYIESYTAQKVQVAPVVNITLKPLVYRYLIRYHFTSGAEYVRLARGALSGMAGNVYLTDGHTGSEPVTVLFDADYKSWGVEAVVNTFGVPDFPNPDYTRGTFFGLNLEVRLGNGKILNFDFDVTEQVLQQPRGGVIDVYGLAIPDEVGREDTGSFGVGMEDWGDYQDVILDLSKPSTN